MEIREADKLHQWRQAANAEIFVPTRELAIERPIFKLDQQGSVNSWLKIGKCVWKTKIHMLPGSEFDSNTEYDDIRSWRWLCPPNSKCESLISVKP